MVCRGWGPWLKTALEVHVGPVTTWPVETPVNVVMAARKPPSSRGDAMDGGGEEVEREEEVEDIRFTRSVLKETGSLLTESAGLEWDAGKQVRRAFWVETDGGTCFRERPAGLKLNPLSGFVERMGTVMPDEWAEENEYDTS